MFEAVWPRGVRCPAYIYGQKPCSFHIQIADAEIFSRGVKCPNVSSTLPDHATAAKNSELTMADAMNISRNPIPQSNGARDMDGPLYGNGRGFCDYSLSLPHSDV